MKEALETKVKNRMDQIKKDPYLEKMKKMVTNLTVEDKVNTQYVLLELEIEQMKRNIQMIIKDKTEQEVILKHMERAKGFVEASRSKAIEDLKKLKKEI